MSRFLGGINLSGTLSSQVSLIVELVFTTLFPLLPGASKDEFVSCAQTAFTSVADSQIFLARCITCAADGCGLPLSSVEVGRIPPP